MSPLPAVLNRAKLAETEQRTGTLREWEQRNVDHTPLGRFGTPEDFLGTVLWFLFPASAHITGAVITAEGSCRLRDV